MIENPFTFDIPRHKNLWSYTIVAKGGTGRISFTSYGLVFGGTSANGALQALAPSATSLTILMGQGASALPIWSTVTWPNSVTQNTVLYGSGSNAVGAIAAANQSTLSTSTTGVPTLSQMLPEGVREANDVNAPPPMAEVFAHDHPSSRNNLRYQNPNPSAMITAIRSFM